MNADKTGVRIRVTHFRWHDDSGRIKAKGGQTLVTLTMGDLCVSGVAECSPRDNYDKKRGREIAEGRAWASIKALNEVTGEALAAK